MIPEKELESIDFLRNLGAQHLATVARLAKPKELARGEVLFSEGQDSSDVYLVLSGEIALGVKESDGKTVSVYAAQPGELLGWSPMLGRHSMTATARAATGCRLAVLDVRQVMDACETYPRFGLAFLREIALVLSDRLWATRRRLASAVGSRVAVGSVAEGSD